MRARSHCIEVVRRPGRSIMAALLAVLGFALLVGPGTGQAMSGGEPVHVRAHAPWMATLIVRGAGPLDRRVSCGGALVAARKVITAAHCVAGVSVSKLKRIADFHIGARTLTRQPGQTVGIAQVAIDPWFKVFRSPAAPTNPSADSAADDLAVVTLSRAVHGIPVIAISPRQPPPGTVADLYGHGITTPASGQSDTLRRGLYVLAPDRACATATPAKVDLASMSCGAGLGAEACEGDSGGPLVVRRHGTPALIGVLSFGMETAGKPCGTPGPNFFTNTAAARPWIERQLHRP
jgi:hypothetical protein